VHQSPAPYKHGQWVSGSWVRAIVFDSDSSDFASSRFSQCPELLEGQRIKWTNFSLSISAVSQLSVVVACRKGHVTGYELWCVSSTNWR